MSQLNGAMDVRGVLPSIGVPTLIAHRDADPFIDIRHAHYLAEHIPGAKLVILPGGDTLPVGDGADALLEELEEFLTGTRTGREPDRVLATVMFTDIVESTRLAAEMGDRRWRDVLSAHDATVRRWLERHRGREVKSVGDGFLATFDGPARAIRCAEVIRDELRGQGIEMRAGLHTGEVEVIGDDVGGTGGPHRRARRRAGRPRRGAGLEHGARPRRGLRHRVRRARDAGAQGRPGRVAPLRRRRRQRPERVAASLLDSGQPGGRSSAGRAPGCGPGGRGFESPRSPSMSDDDDPLERLSAKELHDLAVSRAKRHVDLGFFWRLLKYLPEAEAAAGELDETEADLTTLTAHVDDVTDAGSGEVAELMRPFYIEYLREHGVTPAS